MASPIKHCSSVPSHLSKQPVSERTATLPSAVHGSPRKYPLRTSRVDWPTIMPSTASPRNYASTMQKARSVHDARNHDDVRTGLVTSNESPSKTRHRN